MHVNYRQGEEGDSQRIAELDNMASDGVVEYLFRDLVPTMSAIDVLANGLEKDVYPHTFRSCIVAETEQNVVGMAMSYPAAFHCLSDELMDFIPRDRLERFYAFYSTRVEGSYYLDALSVDEPYRGLGIGRALLEKTKIKAQNEGYTELSLIVFSENTQAIALYQQQGFTGIKNIALEPHELIPHKGGCLLMNCLLGST
jgi:ribosomal protein S18 acetylase RimI-like enzyme